MRTLFFVAAALATLLGASWLLVSAQIEARAEAALADLRAQGWSVEYRSLETRGFPWRFQTTLSDVAVASPDGRLAWSAPGLQVVVPSFRPNRVDVIWSPEQHLTVGGQRFDLSAQDLRAGALVAQSGDLPLDHATLESGPATVGADGGWSLTLGRLLAGVRRADSAPAAYDLTVEAKGLEAAGAPGLFRLDARLTLDAPLDRHLQVSPRLVALALREARLAQGGVALTAAGELAPDARGFLAGTVTLRAENWRGLPDLLEAGGLLVYDQAPLLAQALEELAQGSDRIEVPITFRDGQVEALGLVLLPAPQVL